MIQDPVVNQNPAFGWELRANYLKSLGKKDVEKLIGPKPDFQNNEGDVDDENQMFIQEQRPKVEPQDDHVAHMNGHQQFKRENGQNMTAVALRNLTEHILEHRFAYTNALKEQALLAQGGQAQGGQPNIPGAAPQPGLGTIQGPRVTPQNESPTPPALPQGGGV